MAATWNIKGGQINIYGEKLFRAKFLMRVKAERVLRSGPWLLKNDLAALERYVHERYSKTTNWTLVIFGTKSISHGYAQGRDHYLYCEGSRSSYTNQLPGGREVDKFCPR